jgi:hypothetical protein
MQLATDKGAAMSRDPMANDKWKELMAARARLATLELKLNKELAALPAKYGYASAADFVAAVTAASGGGARRGRKPGRPAGGGPGGPGRKRRRRAVITDETRSQVKKMVADGKTGAEIAKAVGVSLPSVQNIKKALGLVKKR